MFKSEIKMSYPAAIVSVISILLFGPLATMAFFVAYPVVTGMIKDTKNG